MKSSAAEIYQLSFQNSPIILTNCLAAAVLAVSLMFAPAARAEEAQVECAKGIRAERRHCDAVLAEFDAMRDVLANAPPTYPVMQVMIHCVKGLAASIPGYDYNIYLKTCGRILLVLQGH
ncbi:hypothetical protein [Nitrobacter sp. TKz-YC02]|uniref:hypothetical protein n=1 Tax=Nitrobacter sp. TKz-YC02 TaxID=3398704 RepID=UPI003CE7C28E